MLIVVGPGMVGPPGGVPPPVDPFPPPQAVNDAPRTTAPTSVKRAVRRVPLLRVDDISRTGRNKAGSQVVDLALG
jgi:hypothetical protein